MRYDSLFERFYFEDNSTPLLEQTLREMGGITVDVGYNLISPVFNKNRVPNTQEIEDVIDLIFQYTSGGKRIFYDENRKSVDKETWINIVLDKIARIRNMQISKNNTLIKQLFLARMTND